jgi:hypothetical protein
VAYSISAERRKLGLEPPESVRAQISIEGGHIETVALHDGAVGESQFQKVICARALWASRTPPATGVSGATSPAAAMSTCEGATPFLASA